MITATLRPPFALALLIAVIVGVGLAVLPPVYGALDDAAQELRTRRDQRALLQAQSTRKADLEDRVKAASAGFDDTALVYHGASLTEVQATLQAAIRTQVQNSGAHLKSIEIRPSPVAGNRTRLHLVLSASGDNPALLGLILNLERARPRLDIASLRIRTDGAAPPGGFQPLFLDIELDGYSDAS